MYIYTFSLKKRNLIRIKFACDKIKIMCSIVYKMKYLSKLHNFKKFKKDQFI